MDESQQLLGKEKKNVYAVKIVLLFLSTFTQVPRIKIKFVFFFNIKDFFKHLAKIS
jgi:hypothetical protein